MTENRSAKISRANGTARRRRLLPYLGVALLAGAIVAGFWPRPVAVELGRVSTGALRSTVNEEGRTRIRHRFTVSAPVLGQLRRIEFKAGAEVRGGETVVAVIDPLPPALLDARTRRLAEARRDTALANVEKSRAAHVFAQSELRRFEKLAVEKTVSEQELENAQWREASAAKELAASESALRQAEAELIEFGLVGTAGEVGGSAGGRGPVEVKAPVSGRVLRVIEESSRVVSPGTPLMEVGDPADLEVVIEVLSRDAATIGTGTKVDLEQWGGDGVLAGRVRLVEPSAFTKISALGVEEQRVNVIADILTPMADRPGLGDQFRVEARIVVWEAERVLKAPAGALFRRGTNWSAFVVVGGRARVRKVEVGRGSDQEVQVLAGLAEGEQVVIYPGDKIRDGLRVQEIRF